MMIYRLRMGAYEPLAGFDYMGPTHLSIGQEATSVGACEAIAPDDYITSTHRGHGDGLAKGFAALSRASDALLAERSGLPAETEHAALLEAALEAHVYRTIAELFGKSDGYCRGRGGGMHIADFSVGHLGANAIVGGSVGIATGAGYSARYRKSGQACLCFAGDGAYCNGITLESLNMATMSQFTNPALTDVPFGVPVIYAIVNNQYQMTGQSPGEITGVDFMARRGAGFAENNMHAEVVNGMDVLAVLDAVRRARELCRAGQGPVLLELVCYRYYGHSLSDPRNEYRDRDEEAAWKAVDPVTKLSGQLVEAGVCTRDDIKALETKVAERQARAATRAAAASDPPASEVTDLVYCETASDSVPAAYANPKPVGDVPSAERDADGCITYKEAIREAMIEEMLRDGRVVFFGEDVADYGGAFKVTPGMLEALGRDRVFNTSISEAAIIGTGVGMAMTGLRPIVELMYFDFALQASDQISNQAAKWHYMSGGQTSVPLVIRASAGGGKGYGGQHSQTLESIFAHTPGLKIAIPSTPYDAKGLLKTAIRDPNPVIFVEGQLLYNLKGPVPEDEYLIPFGEAAIRREGGDATIVAWAYTAGEALKAADELAADGIAVDVIDPRTLVPFDYDTVIASVQKTGRLLLVSQAVTVGSYTAEVAAEIQRRAFDWLDAPIERLGAANSISPQARTLEQAYLPDAADIVTAVRKLVAR